MNNLFSIKLRGFVDCTDQSLFAKFFRTFALFASIPYSMIIRLRNAMYAYGVIRETHVACKTVVVGNLTLGGVGKTPFIGWLTNHCLELGLKPGLISRGYKGKQQQSLYVPTASNDFRQRAKNFRNADKYRKFNDEAIEHALRFPTIPHFLGANRVKVARALLAQHPEVNVLLLDDAFQHRRIARDFNILILDALNPFGGGRVVPSGFLREPLSGMSRANAILLNRADLIPQSERERIRSEVEKTASNVAWAEIAQRPRRVIRYQKSISQTEETTSVALTQKIDFWDWKASSASKKSFVAFCGLGAPQGFQKTLENEKLDVRQFIPFPDHCVYSPEYYDQLLLEAKRVDAQAFITTMKDFVKLEELISRSDVPVYAIEIGVEFIVGQDEFIKAFNQIIL